MMSTEILSSSNRLRQLQRLMFINSRPCNHGQLLVPAPAINRYHLLHNSSRLDTAGLLNVYNIVDFQLLINCAYTYAAGIVTQFDIITLSSSLLISCQGIQSLAREPQQSSMCKQTERERNSLYTHAAQQNARSISHSIDRSRDPFLFVPPPPDDEKGGGMCVSFQNMLLTFLLVFWQIENQRI